MSAGLHFISPSCAVCQFHGYFSVGRKSVSWVVIGPAFSGGEPCQKERMKRIKLRAQRNSERNEVIEQCYKVKHRDI